jgi:hypothetical protein
MTFEMSDTEQKITIYNLLTLTHEFIGKGDAYIPPHTGLPANSTVIAPPEIPAGSVAIFDLEKETWSLSEDHRGETVYSIATGEEIHISDIGPLPENTVVTAPSGQYEKWDGKGWVKDADAEKAAQVAGAVAEKASRISAASQHIQILNDSIAYDGGQPSDADSLKAWTGYRVLLNRIDTSTAPDIAWPEKPGE